MRLLTHFTSPSLLALPAMTQFSEWQLPSFSSLSTGVNTYRCHPSALHTCSSRGALPKHLTRGLHPSSVDALVDIHNPSHNFPYFHPWEAFLEGHWVTALPFCSCGVISASPPEEVVFEGLDWYTCPMYDGCPYIREHQPLT